MHFTESYKRRLFALGLYVLVGYSLHLHKNFWPLVSVLSRLSIANSLELCFNLVLLETPQKFIVLSSCDHSVVWHCACAPVPVLLYQSCIG
jgi:hypothetical protein